MSLFQGKRVSYPKGLVSLVFLFVFVFFYTLQRPILEDSDAVWHLAAGDYIRAQGVIPQKDIWSYTAGETTWYNISWLWDVLISQVVDWFGLEGAYYFICLWAAATLAYMCHSLLQRKDIKDYAVVVMTLLLVTVLRQYFCLRPQIASYLLLIVFHTVLYRSRERVGGLYFLPPLTALWVNLHGGFLFGLSVIGVYALEALISKNYLWLKHLVIVGILSGLSVFINPYGIGIIAAVMSTLNNPITLYISEWHPFQFFTTFPASLFFLVFILVTHLKDSTISLSDRVLAYLWLFAALLSIRNIPIFAILTAPYMALRLGHMGQPQEFPDFNKIALRPKPTLVTVVLVIGLVASGFRERLIDRPMLYKKEAVPEEAVRFIQAYYPKARILNHYNLGGHIIYFSKGTLPVFVDGRAGTAYPNSIIFDYLKFRTKKLGWESIIDTYDVDLIITLPDSDIVFEYNAAWKKVYETMAAVIYVRKKTTENP